MPAAECFSSVKGLAMRVTRLDACGEWASGASAMATSDGFVKITFSAQIEAGTEFQVKTASGRLCVNQKDCSALKWLDLEMELCSVDPELFELLTGNRVVEDWEGNGTGFTISEDIGCGINFAFEVWTLVAGGSCGGSGYRYVYWLFPFVTNGILGDVTFENGPTTFTVSGNTGTNESWGRGPYNVVPTDAGGTPGVLITPGVDAGEHLYATLTSVAPPTIACGYQPQSFPFHEPV